MKDVKAIEEVKNIPISNNIDNLVLIGQQSLSILFVMGVGLAYKYIIEPQVNRVKNSLSRTIEQEKQLLVLMAQVKEFYGSDRVLLDAIHNGTSIVTGTHLYRISTYLEVTNNSFKSIKEYWQSVPVSSIIPYFEILVNRQNKSFYASNISNCTLINADKEEIKIPIILQEYYSLTDVESIIHILILKNREVTGILCIHNPTRNTNQISTHCEDIEAIYNKKNNFVNKFIK